MTAPPRQASVRKRRKLLHASLPPLTAAWLAKPHKPVGENKPPPACRPEPDYDRAFEPMWSRRFGED
jgi:hypothetical protein